MLYPITRFALAPLVLVLALVVGGCSRFSGSSLGGSSMAPSSGGPLSEADIIAGLKEALRVGTERAVEIVSRHDGYFGDMQIRIPFPPDADDILDAAQRLGLQRQIDDFVERMNRGAEDAAKAAVQIFADAVTSMTFEDARRILDGPDDAATVYFRGRTERRLAELFAGPIRDALQRIGAVSLWREITSAYNRVPFVTPVNTDIVAYATGKALDGLFIKLAAEEARIRRQVEARTTDLLRRVFGAITGR